MFIDEKDFAYERKWMIEHQLRRRGIQDERVLEAMAQVPRHLFVDESIISRAYDDSALPIGEGQTISQPYMVALMTEMLMLTGSERVLEIGTGSGYQACVLARLAAEVYTVERIGSLCLEAQSRFKALDIANIHCIVQNGSLGYQQEAPYDAILVTAASPSVPEPLVNQLKVGGRMVIPVGDKFSQLLYRVDKTHDNIITTTSTPCVFVPLIGECGWKGR
ncbi:MAG TPA: protein-L-isoaspartate(D-aspartate) O-methyltransferase [Thermodesulfovibrionia bacterium]|nr:protein-L-isoaspartate(D-aspartate) O-methyltransferase [Thermodesulfovibrionia bacterium]